ncbi:putative LRR receptor-like serine/threonine-protein kinase [Apostasia shenzhenica]|uniref:non-specific serine/threonine protein kinase n=1 Tax=Apostasia shenzhenica TaxID=1088818 RepID=A0A2I0AGD8_9ASPA|nr:putative LRR receptor-like serine/threonine-protein kinase [Apostasia shenzhenica]
MVLEDFNIQKAAGGPGKSIKMSFNASIKDHTLEIQFYWAGRGTTGIPNRGVYGPLISAISVTPNFDPPRDHTGLKEASKIEIGISALLLFLIILVLGLWWRKKSINRNSMYRDGKIIAVKQLSARSRQGNREFVNEIGMISALQHPNLACVLQERGKLLELMDPDLRSEFSEEEAMLLLNVALLCTNASPSLRPAMSTVVSLLERRTPIQPMLTHLSVLGNTSSSNGIRRSFWENPSELADTSNSFIYSSGTESLLEHEGNVAFPAEAKT